MAQTEAAFGHRLANLWVHNDFMLVDGAKMAKSRGNSYIMRDITGKGFDPLALRLLYLQAHYRSEINFTWDSLEAATNRLNDLRALAALQWQPQAATHDAASFALPDVAPTILASLQNDLDTPAALAYLSDVSKQLQATLVSEELLSEFKDMLGALDDLLGLRLSEVSDISAEQKQLIADREAARSAKDWAKSDLLRDQLTAQGIGQRDTPSGTVWFRT